MLQATTVSNFRFIVDASWLANRPTDYSTVGGGNRDWFSPSSNQLAVDGADWYSSSQVGTGHQSMFSALVLWPLID